MFSSLSDRTYFALSMMLFAAIILVMLFISSLFMNNPWANYDTARFYAMAQGIVNGATPYLDYQDPKPPLIYFTLTVPILLGQKVLGGLLLVGACNLVSAALVMVIAKDLYGRFSGFLAGLLFTVNIGFAQGYFVLTEPFAITFVLLATYLVMKKKHYLVSGLLTGIAIGFKQYALLTVPFLLYLLNRDGQFKRVPPFIVGVLVPLVVIFGVILVVYGSQALNASLYWSFGVAGEYVTEKDMGNVTSYRTTDPLMIAANIGMSASVFTSLAILALAGLVWDRRLKPIEEYMLLSAIGFTLTLLVRQYLHYWVLALPFYAIMCARLFRNSEITTRTSF